VCKPWKIPAIVLAAVLALVVLVVFGGWLYLRRSLTQIDGTLKMAGLQGPVEVIRDRYGIPHIYASTDHDAFFALGYAHAQDRLWQMELQRRIGAGRLSEIFGDKTLETDQFLRTVGFYRAAQAAWPALSPETQATLQAYADGVNAFLAGGHALPPEFAILGVKPEPWLPADSLVWAKMMAWNLGETYGDDLLHAELIAALGPERSAQLAYIYPAGAPVILPQEAMTGLLEAGKALREQTGLGGKQVGSNNWVVSGARTASGKPLLANDPHLGAQIPSIWYLASVQGERVHAIGATLPGTPLVVIGHNQDIAWGVTNLGPDVQDLFIERVNPANPNQYEVDGRWADMQVIPEQISVKGKKEPVKWAARATRHGPLISDVTSQRGQALALRWPALDPGDTTVQAFLEVNYAHNWDDLTRALQLYVAPAQNFVYADREGNIGYFGPGKIPIRAAGDGSAPVPGWNDDYAWTGWIPFDQLPHAYNPAEGYLVTANNRVTPDGYPYFITNNWAPPYRAERIRELLSATQGLTPNDFARIQGDQQSAQARELLPLLLAVQPQTPEEAQALDILRRWDGIISPDAAAPAIYEAWYTKLFGALLGDDLGGEVGDYFTTANDPILLARILGGEEAVWCDNVLTPGPETCAETACVALQDALEELQQRLGKDMGKWRWGDLHRTVFPHNPFSQVSFLKPLFERSIVTGGDSFTVNPGPYKLEAPFDSGWVPSYREIIDLADLGNSRFIHTTGQSGNFLSKHYDDLIPLWRQVQYLPMYWDKPQVAANAEGTLRLEPQ
jgi:penicillin amidase